MCSNEGCASAALIEDLHPHLTQQRAAWPVSHVSIDSSAQGVEFVVVHTRVELGVEQAGKASQSRTGQERCRGRSMRCAHVLVDERDAFTSDRTHQIRSFFGIA